MKLSNFYPLSQWDRINNLVKLMSITDKNLLYKPYQALTSTNNVNGQRYSQNIITTTKADVKNLVDKHVLLKKYLPNVLKDISAKITKG